MLKPVLRLAQQQYRLTFCTRQINDVLVIVKERQPELVRRHECGPPDLAGLQRQTVPVFVPMVQRVRLRTAQVEQYATPSGVSNMPVVLQKISLIADTPPPLRLENFRQVSTPPGKYPSGQANSRQGKASAGRTTQSIVPCYRIRAT